MGRKSMYPTEVRERVAVLAYELAHELLHQGAEEQKRSTAELETEAEATS